jgi:hypothetical protein
MSAPDLTGVRFGVSLQSKRQRKESVVRSYGACAAIVGMRYFYQPTRSRLAIPSRAAAFDVMWPR